MGAHFSNPAAESSFEIDFNGGGAESHNRDLSGKGQLVVREAEPRFVFRGKARKTFSIGATATEIALRSDEIANVVLDGATVKFATPHGKSGASKKPFTFNCANAGYAAAIAALLPATKDVEFVASEEFFERFRQLPGGGTGLGSITNLLLLANGIVFVVMGFLGAGWVEVASMEPYIRYGANNAAATTDGEWWRLVTCMFMHYGLVHLLLNGWALFQTGHFVERLFGRPLYTLVYFGSGITGSVGTLLWKGDQAWSAGASGAVFGVFGALLGYLLREKRAIPKGVFQPMLNSTLAFAGYNLLFGAIHPNIDNAAHLGGLFGGAILGWICAMPPDREVRARQGVHRGVLAAAFTAVVVGVGFVSAPRFDYRVSDQRTYYEVHRLLARAEHDVTQQANEALAQYAQRGAATDLTRWLTSVGIPFYESWTATLAALPFALDRRTARERDKQLRLFLLQLESYRLLLTAVNDGSPTAFRDFGEAQKKVKAVSEGPAK